MLKLRAPIKTSIKTDMLSSQESFYERIRGNYMLTGSNIDETDLLHVVTQPPQLFLMNGGMTGIVNSTNVENNQIRKVGIINNLINRITISADAGLSYQDNVFITNILHKLGIKNEKKFMKEVYKNTEEIKQKNELVELYWENLNEIRSLVNEYSEENEYKIKSESEVLNANVLHLHEEVNRRLQTAAIYQILRNFYANMEEPRTVSGTEYRITQQERFAKEVLLNRLRETAREETQPLIYRQENIYEGDEGDRTDITVQDITERISSAVLLDMITNVYEDTYERLDKTVHNWLSTEDVYYGAAENTLYRIENNTAYLQYLHEQSLKNEEGDNYNTEEINILRQLLTIWNSSDMRIQQSIGGNIYEDNSENIRNLGDILSEQTDQNFENAEMEFVTNEGDVNEENVTNEKRDELTEKIYQTYQQNIARNERYMQNLKNIMQQYERPAETESPRERMMRESRLALEHPEQFMEEYRQEQKAEAERLEIISRETEKLLPPIQQVTHELIREYLQAPERFRYSERMSVNNMGLLMRDIYEAQRQERIEAGEESPETGNELTLERPEAEVVYQPIYRPQEKSGSQSGAYPAVTGRYEPAGSDNYYETLLQNIYPVYQSEIIFRNADTTIEMLAEAVKEHSEELEKNAEERQKARIAAEAVKESETRVEKSFTSVFENERVLRESELEFADRTSIVNNITRNIILRMVERNFRTPEPGETFETENATIVHRIQETSVSEETIENLREEMKRIEETNRTTGERVQNIETQNRTVVNSVTNETVEINTEKIQNIVNSQVRAQIDSISDKVYGRIERQLRNEQRRRGL